MADHANDFSSLPPEYQEVLRLAREIHDIEITPLQELKGGRTEACLYLVSVTPANAEKLEHFILKLDHKSKKTDLDELKRHQSALNQAPPEFARQHIAGLAFERVEHEGTVAIFYTIAGQSLHHYRSLAGYQQQNRLEKIFAMTNQILLNSWNAGASFEQAVPPQKLLAGWLGYRLKPGGDIERFLEEVCHIQPTTAGLLIEGNVFPNPLLFAREADRWEGVRPIDALTGFQHGDLNIGNILTRFSGEDDRLAGYYLIDFALFKSKMPLFYDHHYLEMSYLIRELARVPLPKWVDLVTRFAGQDIIDPQQVPIELSGACAVIGAGRKAFNDWLQGSFPSLSDDLWGQYWLAAAAAGLNYCNKTMLSEKERLGGLIFAAAHLKRYHATFGLPLPVEVKHLNIVEPAAGPHGTGTSVLIHTSAQIRNLPVQPTPFIGREQEIASLTELLRREEVRLLTLTGPGGTGKTRLALRTAATLAGDYEDGIYFIDLAPIRESESVLTALAQTIGLRETGDRPLPEALKDHLRKRQLLLILDNFEQVTAAAPAIGDLLRACTGLKLLVTSRGALHISGEQVFPVPPLALPAAGLKKITVKELNQFEAVRLFIERARAVKPNFELTEENAQAVAAICSRLDGLPLAIELATARLSLFTPQALLERLDSRLKLLRGGARDLPARQQTLRDTIDWSYEQLSHGEQRLFALLSVFSGCTFEAVEAVAGGIKNLIETNLDVLDGMASLIDKSLIRRVDQGSGEPLLQMLETIREYAAEQLDGESDFSAAAHRAHAAYFADFTQRQWDRLSGPGRDEALAEMESNLDNMRIAWRYWVAEKAAEQLRKLMDCLWLLYEARGWYYAMLDLTSDLLTVFASAPSSPEHARQEIMLQTSLARVLMSIKGYTAEVEKAYTRALELCNEHGEIPQMFPVLRGLASFYVYSADFKKGAQMGEQILRLAEQHDDKNMRVEGNLIFGYSLAFQGDLKLGLEYIEKGMAIYDPGHGRSQSFRFGNNPGVASLTTSALFLWMLGFPDRALQRANEAIDLANRINHPFSLTYALFHSGLLHLWRREVETVLERAQAVLEIAAKYEFKIWKAVSTCLYGAALAGLNRVEEGCIRIKEGMDLYEELKTPPVFWPLLLILRAGASGQAGKTGEGLRLSDQALEIIGRDSGNPVSSEIFRLKGDLLLMHDPRNPAEAEKCFRQALEVGRERQAGMLILRASISLSRLWQTQNKGEQGRQLLREAYDTFSEGFSTADLTDAKTLLQELDQTIT